MREQLKKWLPFLGAILVILGLDQWTKALAIRHLMNGPSVVLIPGVLELEYVENTGMAFGLFKDRLVFFLIATAVVLGFIVFFVIRTPATKRMTGFLLALSFISGGAVGNLIDRVFRRYVVDFIYVSWIDFPVFNVADSFVTIGTILLVILILFVYKDKDLEPVFRFRKKKKAADGGDD